MEGRLYVDFCGEEHVVAPGESLSFGREADLVIDENPYMHRVVGRFVNGDGRWWLDNVCSATVLNLAERNHVDGNTPVTSVIAPGSRMALSSAEFGCGFLAGSTRYELEGALEVAPSDLAHDGCHLERDGTGRRTLEWGIVELNDDQRLLLVALAEQWLRDPLSHGHAVPARRASARRLGWSLSKYNRKLDHLCAKLARVGVDGLYGQEGLQALDRRRVLAEHVVRSALVNADDLRLLDELQG